MTQSAERGHRVPAEAISAERASSNPGEDCDVVPGEDEIHRDGIRMNVILIDERDPVDE